MMGVCFECLIEIDGIPNQLACMIPVREAMKIKRQQKNKE
jgi:NADH dehydrogenase/NADH:ubiquinone oxidoreductase subunit G